MSFADGRRFDERLVGDDPVPAEKAGVRARDLLIRYDSSQITRIDDLQKQLTEARSGVPTQWELIRATQKLTVSAVPQEAVDRGQLAPKRLKSVAEVHDRSHVGSITDDKLTVH